MYKVLLVDDEELVVQGISSLIPWEKNGFRLLEPAYNGAEALERFRREPADIVITDIRMPLMNGLDLIRQLRAESPHTEYIVLSGYGEYDYTSEAMAQGVKHYLLKPSNEMKILEVLHTVAAELKRRSEHAEFVERLQNDFKKVLPHVKEQLLRDIVLTGMYNKQDCDYFMDLFMIEQQLFKLVLFGFHGETEYIHKFALRNIAGEVFRDEGAYLTTVVRDQMLLLVKAVDFGQLSAKVKQVQRIYKAYYKLECFVAVSNEGGFTAIRSMYDTVRRCLSFGLSFQEGFIVTPQDVPDAEKELPVDAANVSERLVLAVRAGNAAEIRDTLNEAGGLLGNGVHDAAAARKLCLELFLAVIRQSEGGLDEYVTAIPQLYNMPSLREAFQLLEETALELAARHSGRTAKRQNDLIDSVLRIVQDNLGNPDLSLKWIGSELLYVNVDYLGKMFTRKTGSKFSGYLLQLRMESAKRLMEQERELRIYDIAVMLGYPEDAQYFSKLFKKYTGMTPTEYMRGSEGQKQQPF
ncbi:response regulator [Paenibacillus camerounensis]|uniref:response regulator n=1 Tax=Paenibacillus camerounensis TaxID=1243663 RepID=UPI0005AB563C|nr:response regulator [Paenibacillus camerounensis]